MNTKEFAKMLNGRERGAEISREEERLAKTHGLVVVFGASDDLMEICGAIEEEFDCYEGGTTHITKTGVLSEPECDPEDCPYFAAARSVAKTIKAVWHDEGGPCWTYETEIPHETFNICEDGEVWCIGIVFSVEDLT